MKLAYVYRARVLSVYDGDTCRLNVDLGFTVNVEQSCRLLGINCRELHDPGGLEARRALARLIPVGSTVTVESVGFDKYGGRFDGKLTNAKGLDVSAEMIRLGWAAPWDGTDDKPLPAWPKP